MKKNINLVLKIYDTNKTAIISNPSFFLNLLEQKLNMFICTRPEVYEDGVNYLVQVLTVDETSPTKYNEKLCTGSWGDNAEFASINEARIFGIEKSRELLKNYIE